MGWEPARTLAPLGQVPACGRHHVDVADADALCDLVRRLKPGVIVNAAAYTVVDRAESDASTALLVTTPRHPAYWAEEAEKLGAWLLHYSTDYVFDGSKRGAYREDDVPNPLNAYSRSKLAGGQAIMSAANRHLILRTRWLYGNGGSNFLPSMRESSAVSDEIRVATDQIGAPTWHRLVAEATAIALGQLRSVDPRVVSGIYQLACARRASGFEFAQATFDEYESSRRPKIVPLTSLQHAATARRPLNSLMSNQKIQATVGVVMLLPPSARALWRRAETSLRPSENVDALGRARRLFVTRGANLH